MFEEDDKKGLFDYLTLGIIQTLGKKTGVCNVTVSDTAPTERHVLVSWEQKYSCILPDDLRNFYLTLGLLKLKWSIKLNAQTLPLGKMNVNPISKMTRIGGISGHQSDDSPYLADIEQSDDEDDDDISKPRFDSRSRLFELDSCDGYGKVILAYKDTKPGIPASKPEVWFLDRALQWHFLAVNFTSYFRLMIMHLGLPQWQYAFTKIGLSPQVKQWFHLFAPVRQDLDEGVFHVSENSNQKTDTVQHLDVGKVFKGKSDKKKPPSQNVTKKKPAAPSSTRTSGNVGKSMVSSLLSNKSTSR